MAVSLAATNLSKKFDAFLALAPVSFELNTGEITILSGSNGSGKTTILKLLLRFYTPQKGEIKVGATYMDQIGYRYWRGQCCIVMQDGFFFSDSIAKNIVVADVRDVAIFPIFVLYRHFTCLSLRIYLNFVHEY